MPDKPFEDFNPHNMISLNTKIGKNVTIGNFVIIEPDVVIEDNVTIKDYVRLSSRTYIGEGCAIDSYVKTSGDCQVGNRCTLRYNCTIARSMSIGNDVFIAPNVMTIFEEGKFTSVGSRVKIYTASVLQAGVHVCDDAVIGAMSFVNSNIVEPGTYVGIPAKKIG